MNETQKKILSVFKYLLSVLDNHNLKYVACGGTVLGAIRHKGFIPWDDDIDIYMPRADYEIFLKLKDEVRIDGYDIISEADEGYYLPFAKIIDSKTTIWEHENIPYLLGVYVDVFPLDEFEEKNGIAKIQTKYCKWFERYQNSLKQIPLLRIFDSFVHCDYNNIIIGLMSKLLNKKIAYKFFLNYKKKNIGKSGPWCVNLSIWIGKIFKTEWFEDAVEKPFEDIMIKIPRDYDDYLKLIYDDYMTLPPVEERISNHLRYFIDIHKRWTIEDIRKLKKNGK